ncbi:hypothetical protein I4F81_010878 [Pyropia yezoensis]|uniref:Uncharacterized protein n=1 Tax=Pyropia yezoensis TaxID=2788 RepID=A0ACC3CEL5_PYRYE|nr:hypothetical protein I4F81_010878 [Neopyropia yezoensis]
MMVVMTGSAHAFAREDYGSVVVRYIDPDTFQAVERSLGVWRCAGRHNYFSIRSWLENRLGYFGVAAGDIASSTTDSGANVRKAMLEITAGWVPCAAHSLHNAFRLALGRSGESADQRAARGANGGPRAQRRLKECRNTPMRELLSRLRATVRFFEHSDAEALSLNAVPVSEDPQIRGLRQEVATRWGSTLFCVQRLNTMFPRLTVYFRYRDLTAEQRSRRVAQADWDPLRHLIGVLSPVAEVTKACQSSTATLADISTKLVQQRLTLLSDVVDVPKLPDVSLAVGAAAIEAFLKDFPEEDVVELDNRLYGSELIYLEETEGYDNLCTEAPLAVY